MKRILKLFLTEMLHKHTTFRLTISLVLLAFILPSYAQSGCSCMRQLIYNNSFETGNTTGWNTSSGNVTIWSGGGKDGTYYAGINYTDNAGSYSMYQDWNNVIEGRTYNFSGFFTTHNGSKYSVIRLLFFDAANTQVGTTFEQEINTTYPTWTTVTHTAVAPTGATKVRILGYTENTALKMDGVKLETCFEPIIKFANLNDTSVCSGGSAALNAVLSDPSVPVTYQWQSKTSVSSWADISTATSASYTASNVSVSTQYRVKATPTSGVCSSVLSNPVSVNTITSPTLSISSSATKICPFGSVNLSSSVSPTGSYGYQWQSSTDSISWTNVSSATAATKTVTNITGQLYFRLKLVASACTFYSTGLKISAYDDVAPILSGVPGNTTVSCSAIPNAATPTATDNCGLQDIVFQETYSSCSNPVLNTNSGIENPSNVAMDTTFQGYPAKKLPNYSTAITGWEMGFPASASKSAVLVHDNNNSINNPDGSYFMWVPSNSYCVINNPVSLQAGQCVEISLWAASFSSTAPQQSTHIKIEVFRVSDNQAFEPYFQLLPASTSVTNMNWQRIVTKFVTPTAGSYKFVVTQEVDPVYGPTPKGFALDGFELKNCCTTAPTTCENYTITRTWTARDQTGNATKQTQVITVQDTQAPTLNNVPANITVCGTVPAAPTLTATDNCDATPSVSMMSEVSTKTSNSSCTDNFYTVTRVWKATDNCGNMATATQVITVVAAPTPIITATPLCIGGTTTLTTTISACITAANYQWQHWNGSTWDNVGTSSATYNTTAISTNQDYKVMVTVANSTCSGTSATYTVKPAAALSVNITTANATVCVNSSAVLSANVTGGEGNFTYKWQKSSDNLNWGDIANETTANYILPTGIAGTAYYRVIVTASGSNCGSATAQGLKIVVANTAGCDCVLQSCSAYTKLVYKNPVQITDVTGLVGDRWRFSDVATGFDAIVEITNATNANSLNAIDNTAVNIDDWCPEINFNFLAGQDSYVDWKITIVSTGTETPANLPTSSRVTSYDVDGNSNYREMHGHINSNGYIVNNPTELTMVQESPFTLVVGSPNEYTSISTDSKVKATFYYPGQNNVFTIRLGVRTTNAVSAGYRQFAVSFDPCISYTNPDVNPQKPEIEGTAATCIEGSNQTYTTTQPFTSYTWAVTGGTIVSGQGTNAITVNWTTTGAKVVSISTIDANGCVGTANYAVTVANAPSVSVNTNNAVLCQNETFTLQATVTGGTVPITYQWQSSSSDFQWKDIAGAKGLSYQITSNTIGETYYRIIVTFENSGCQEVFSAPIKVEYVTKLAISAPLVGFTECLGGTKKLEIVAIGGKNVKYQWQKLNEINNWVNIDGEIGLSYIPPSNALTTTQYRVHITSESTGCTTLDSDPVAVTVVADPTINVSVTATSVCTGGTVVLTANVSDPSNSCTIEWFSKVGTADWIKISGATDPTYTAQTLNNTTRYKVGLNCAANGCCN